MQPRYGAKGSNVDVEPRTVAVQVREEPFGHEERAEAVGGNGYVRDAGISLTLRVRPA